MDSICDTKDQQKRTIRMKMPLTKLNLSKLFAPVATTVLTAMPLLMKSQTMASADNTPPVTKTTSFTKNADEATYHGTDPKSDEPNVLYDDVTDAQDVSLYRDGFWEKDKKQDPHYVGVYLVIDEDCKMSNEALIDRVLEPLFKHYGLPVKYVRQKVPDPGTMASARFYVNGDSYRGDMSNGNLTFVEIRDNHREIFAKLRQMYDAANAPETAMVNEPN